GCTTNPLWRCVSAGGTLMDHRQRILLEKLTRPEDIPEAPASEQAELREEAGINAALAGLHVRSGMEPPRERVLAAARQQMHETDREKTMNPILRLLSGRSWPARLAI